MLLSIEVLPSIIDTAICTMTLESQTWEDSRTIPWQGPGKSGASTVSQRSPGPPIPRAPHAWPEIRYLGTQEARTRVSARSGGRKIRKGEAVHMPSMSDLISGEVIAYAEDMAVVVVHSERGDCICLILERSTGEFDAVTLERPVGANIALN